MAIHALEFVGMKTDSEPWSVPPEVVESLAKQHAAFPELAALPPLLTMRAACKAVGMSYPTVRRRIADGTLKAYRVGPREIRVSRDSLIAMVCSTVVGA